VAQLAGRYRRALMASIPAELLLRVPGCADGHPPRDVQVLAGGRGANSVWRVRTREGDFALRLRHPPVDRAGSFSRFELASHGLAAEAGLAPRLIDAHPDGHWLLMEFVDAPVWDEARLLSAAGIDTVGEMLQRLHSLDCGSLPRADAAGIARGYQRTLVGRRPGPWPRMDAVAAAVERDAIELARLADRAVLNHGDLMAENLVGGGAGALGPFLVDWEYAQRADPTWDVACLLVYYPALEKDEDRLLRACGLATADDRHILSVQRRVFAGLNGLWRQAET